MKIGIDARFYGPIKQKGLGRYVQELVIGLERNDQRNEYVIFLRKENWDDYRPQNKRFKKMLADYRWYTLKEQILMPIKIKQSGVGLMHFPHFNVPLFCPVDFVVTIHDLILKKFPTRKASTLGLTLYKIKNIVYSFVIKNAIRKSKKIIAVSKFTKKDILENFDVSDDKIEVIYEGVSCGDVKIRDGMNREFLFEKFNIEKPYFLYVGNAYPHKNLEALIVSFNNFNSKNNKEWQLVLVGQIDYFYQKIKDLVRQNKISRIIFTDFVTDKELVELYKNAFLYIFPSRYEGFGLPPLEAMSLGVPVLSSDSSCLPEILGEAALYFNPQKDGDMENKLSVVAVNQQLRDSLSLRGRELVRKYSWDKMTRKIAEKIY